MPATKLYSSSMVPANVSRGSSTVLAIVVGGVVRCQRGSSGSLGWQYGAGDWYLDWLLYKQEES